MVHHGLIQRGDGGGYIIPRERMADHLNTLSLRIQALETVDIQGKMSTIDAAFTETMGYIAGIKEENEKIKKMMKNAEDDMNNTKNQLSIHQQSYDDLVGKTKKLSMMQPMKSHSKGPSWTSSLVNALCMQPR